MAVRLFALLAFSFLLVTSREPPWADAHVTYDTTQALVDRGELDVTLPGPPQFYFHRDGRKYGVFPLGNVVAMIPSHLAYRGLLRLWPELPERALYATTAHLSPSLMMAAACVLFFLILRGRRWGESERSATLATLVLAFCTICLVYARSTYSEAVQTLALVWLIERTLHQARGPTLGGMGWLGIAAGLLVNAKIVNVLLLPPIAIYLIAAAWRARALAQLARALPLGILAFGELFFVALLHNHLKTGSWLDTGYRIGPGIFTGDLWAGLHGFLFSSGKSLFLYSPPLLLAVAGIPTAWRRRRDETALLLSLIAIVLVVNAKFRHWHADYCWGPRHTVPITPLIFLLAFPWLSDALCRGRRILRRLGLAVLLVAALGVQGLGSALYWDHYIRVLIAVKDQTGAPGWFTEHLSHGHYIPRFSPILGHAWLLRHLWRGDAALERDAPWIDLVPGKLDLSDAWLRLRPDWWFVEWLPHVIDPRPAKDSRTPPLRDPRSAIILLVLLAWGVALSAASVLRRLRPRRLP